MAGYAGARPRSGFPWRRAAAPTREVVRDPRDAGMPRRRVRGGVASRARRRSSRTGILVAAIVVTFGLAFVSLAQTVRLSTDGVELDRLAGDLTILQGEQQEIESDLYRLGSEPAVRKQALDAGLGQLVDPLVVPAR
ncbi:MAG: hypothetical protein M0T75_12495 [Chloroflexi bacterium]|nr:hypothetical protein [Chloroflexota bacterium]